MAHDHWIDVFNFNVEEWPLLGLHASGTAGMLAGC